MLEGRRILVTGAASGIGAAAARVFAGYGARLVLADLADIGGPPEGARAIRCDVADPAAIAMLLDEIEDMMGVLDGAFNNAGIEGAGGRMLPIGDYPAEEMDRVIDGNVKGLWHLIRAELPLLRGGNGPAIVNTGSVMGAKGAPGMSAYVASKHAIAGLTRTVALEEAVNGLRVNAVMPGPIATPMLTERGFKVNPGFRAQAEASTPLGRLGRPEEVAEAAAWLLSERSSYVTGHLLAVDGGMCAT